MKDSNKKPKEFNIPVAGSLGILALGAKGVRAWRKVRTEFKNQNLKPLPDEKE